MSDVIKEGDSLVMSYNDTRYFLCYNISASTRVKLGKETVSSDKLIGLPYGSLFEVFGGKKPAGGTGEPQKKKGRKAPIAKEMRVLSKRPSPSDFMDVTDDADLLIEKDNRNLKQDGSAQQLSHAEIEEMKERKQEKAMVEGGANGASIIKALIENSATWETKTRFSQEKWLKRKLAKYCAYYQVLPHNSYNITKALNARDPNKVQGLRFDSLALILTYSNVYSGCDVLCCDHSGGLITGSVMERLYGDAKVTVVDRRTPAVSVLRLFNLPLQVSQTMRSVSWNDLLAAPLDDHQYDSIILNVSHDPAQAFHLAIPRLRLGGTIVIFSQYMEAVQPLLQWCRSKEGCMIRYGVSEVISRHIQVLPNRTHPNMRMDSRSGFVFYACKVQKTDPSAAPNPIQPKNEENTGAVGEPPAKREKIVEEKEDV